MDMNNTGIVPTMPIGGGFGSDGIWIVILLALMFGGNGFGFGGNGNFATTEYVSNEFTQRDINSGFQNTNNILTNGFQSLNTGILENRYAAELSASNTQRDILQQTNELNTNLLTSNLQAQAKMDECCCNLKAQSIENTQKILDAMNQNTIDSLRSEVNDLKNTITSNMVSNNVINTVSPRPIPAYIVSNPSL
jgi:hypothetical protein